MRTHYTRRCWLGCLLSLALICLGCPAEVPEKGSGVDGGTGKNAGAKPLIAFVPNGISDYWNIAIAGANDAAKEFNVSVDVRSPRDIAEQRRMLEELVAKGVQGIAVSPIDGAGMVDIINTCAEHAKLITQDSDAPASKRLAYIGMSNYDAGRMCGEFVRETLPEGGSIMIFIGRIEQENGRQRTKGTIDAILGRPHNPQQDLPDLSQPLTDGKYTILGVRIDKDNRSDGKAQAEDAMSRYPDLTCMVGLFAYNPPILLEALKSADKLGKIKVVGFDETDATLQAIVDGHCSGTIVQNPYQYGYQSVKLLASLVRGDESAIPPSIVIDLPARKITKANVGEFWAELKRLLGKP